ncbi:hypothetical protein TVAG_146600 [Trichomonas vaginalis G3]|uniref:Uncharacterized protein n=1 Tax=Trichomonas vaginalis (strain ATCC PRA-98 / G3) TaxID=412133 RepID=A2DKW4_TRIV3|nr:hypothetical protein TVAGG3_0361580 [Trichomonas vaginalis G3]EAY18917.1 hypothetical protein TVAG_146600 [Trichomonas vaginalis G3]KAI5531978.1 hypothetical protein TVAGG3_0361580 [Trichomonas vaginalis G3]|eukprot:XP_001579903.1 hypothetical protein [Trichomonas vaginalis G3]
MQLQHSCAMNTLVDEESNNLPMSLSRQLQTTNFFSPKTFNNKLAFELDDQDDVFIGLYESKSIGNSIRFKNPFLNRNESLYKVKVFFMFNVQTNNLPLIQHSFPITADLSQLYNFVANSDFVLNREPHNREFNISFNPSWESECLPTTGKLEKFHNLLTHYLTLYVNFH